MTRKTPGAVAALALIAAAVAALLGGSAAGSSEERGPGRIRPAGDHANWTTVYRSPAPIEGLTADRAGNLYVADRGSPCRVLRITRATGAAVVVGTITPPCSPSGLAFDDDGKLYVTGSGAQQDQIVMLAPDAGTPPVATVFGTGVPGANGVAFDRRGNLWTGDGTTGQGRVWRIPPDGGAGVEVFRVQPLANDVIPTGVGRDVRSLPPGTIAITPTSRTASNTAGSQPLVANGVAFTEDGTLLVADTARGALWSVELDRDGNVESPMGCDGTFPDDTLCLDDVAVQHPYLEGADGIALDRAGNVFAAANERNAIVVATRSGEVGEFYRSPAVGTPPLRNQGPLELPTSPFPVGRTLCVTQSDGNRRDNSPNSAGETGPGRPFVAKISCLDQPLQTPGLPLPVGARD
jgi:sugar lactone lactonase YvrE